MRTVVCGIIKNKGKYLLSKRSKNKKEYPLRWEFPGGYCERGEKIYDGLRREIMEELNLEIYDIKLRYVLGNFEGKKIYYCECRIKEIKDLRLESREVEEVEEVLLIGEKEMIGDDKRIFNLINQ